MKFKQYPGRPQFRPVPEKQSETGMACIYGISIIARLLNQMVDDDDCADALISEELRNNYIRGGLITAINARYYLQT